MGAAQLDDPVRGRGAGELRAVPLIWMIGSHVSGAVYPATKPSPRWRRGEIYSYLRAVRPGWGRSPRRGFSGIVKSLRIVAGSFSIAGAPSGTAKAGDWNATRPRHLPRCGFWAERVASALGARNLLRESAVGWAIRATGLLMTLLFSFFFTSVAANAIATTRRGTPVSGMTMLTHSSPRWCC